jgi:hypothetical protein
MKRSFLLTLLVTLFSIACKTKPNEEQPKPETPKAFEEKDFISSISKRSSYENLLENLYSELVDKTQSLKVLEAKIKETKEAESDSLKGFKLYNQKSDQYYLEAIQVTRGLSDSILRERINLLIGQSLAQYKNNIGADSSLLLSIDKKTTKLQDVHTILKIVKTLPLMEKFQKENKPSTKKLEGFEHQVDETIKAVETETKN